MTANLAPETASPENFAAMTSSSILPVVKTPPPPPLPPVRRSSINKPISKSSSLAVLSPSAFASPLLSGHGQQLLSRGSRRTSTPLEGAKSQGIDFGKPLGRQASFINAMVLAEETEENVEVYESCIGEKSTPKKNMVTFNSSVEEFSASSLISRTSVGSEKKCEVAELAWPESPVKPVVSSDDLYCDDDELFSPHMQLIGDEKSSLMQLVGDEKNSAEATTQTEDSSFLSGSESLLKKSSQGDGSAHHAAANKEEAGFNSEDDNFLTGQLQQLSCEDQEEVNESAEREQLGEEGEGQNIVANTLEVALQCTEPYRRKGNFGENHGEVSEEEEDFESYIQRAEVEGGSQEDELETCLDGSNTEKDNCKEWSGQEDDCELHHLETRSESHIENMESCLDGSYTEKDKRGNYEGEVQEVVTASLEQNHAEGIMNISISQSSNWPKENIETRAIGDTSVAVSSGEEPTTFPLVGNESEVEDEQEMCFESFHPMEKVQGWNSEHGNDVEVGPEEDIGVEPSATENSDLFQSYPATVLEGQEQIREVEVEELDKSGVEDNLWIVGDRCVARWEEEQGGDGLWYRAQVGQELKFCVKLQFL